MDLNNLFVGSSNVIIHLRFLRNVHTHWIHTRLYVNDRRRGGEENGVFEVVHLQSGRHDDELQLRLHFAFGIKLRTQRNNAREQSEEEIGIEIAFVRFI